MTRHLLKMIWNRKGANFLIVLEIFASFLVVFALAAAGIHMVAAYERPLGYDWNDVWVVEISRNVQERWSSADSETLSRLLEAARSCPEVVAAGGASTVPYGGSVDINGWIAGETRYRAEVSYVTPEIRDVLRIGVIAGHWFEPSDEDLDGEAVIVNRMLGSQVVEGGDPLAVRPGQPLSDERRIVGVVEDFRRGGELSDGGPYMLILASLKEAEHPPALHTMLLRVAPGTTAAFEEQLLATLQPIARGWTFSVDRMDAMRESELKKRLIPTAAAGVVAIFLLFMVVLGLTGVMWQNVTRRTREFGLRRAAGAHRASICRQIVAEVAVTAGLGIAAGAVVAAQVPLIGPFAFIGWTDTIPALAAAAGAILLLSAICGLYPGWTATRIQPAEALHYE